jgi:photosystem II stability/assembly factor-like uncharacterized protein
MQVVETTGWERLAEREGGTVTALASARDGDGSGVLFAATAVGIRRSLDGGQTWIAQDVGQGAPFVTALAPSANFATDQTLFIGTADGCYRSTDAGKNWHPILTGGRIFGLSITPGGGRGGGDEETGTLFVGTESDGIIRTDDGGRNWGHANPGLLDLTVLALAFSPRFVQDGTGFTATAAGLYRTRNGGKAWRQVDLPVEDPAVQCLGISPSFATDKTVYAGTEADGLFRSDDAGNTWEEIEALTGRSVAALAFSDDGSLIAAATSDGIAVSTDDGATWRIGGGDLGFALSLACVEHDGTEVLVAGLVGQGIARSIDGGQSWTLANEGLRATPTLSLVLSPAFEEDQTVFAAGLDDGVTVSRDGGLTWASANEGLSETTVYGVVVSPEYATDKTAYVATVAGIFRSRDGAASWEPVEAKNLPGPAGALAIAPASGNGRTMLLAVTLNGDLHGSEDGGATWQPLGRFGGAGVVALAVSPGYAKDKTIVVGTRAALPNDYFNSALSLWRSTDGGATWDRWMEERGRSALPLAIPPGHLGDGALYVGLDGVIAKPIRNTWRRGGPSTAARVPVWITVRLADEQGYSPAITGIVVSPQYRSDNTVFVATSAGIFVSRDAGRNFAQWSGSMGATPVVALAVTGRAGGERGEQWVYALGLGGTIWRRRGDDE